MTQASTSEAPQHSASAIPSSGTERFAADARTARHAQAIFIIMLLAYLAGDAVSAARLWNFDASAAAIHEIDGWVDYSRLDKGRRPVVRVSSAQGTMVPLTCPAQAFPSDWLCPPGSPAWNGRKVVAEWIAVPTGWSGTLAYRALRIRAGNETLFEASPNEVVRADLSANLFGMLVALAIFCPIALVFRGPERLSRRRFADMDARVAATRQRHAAGGD